ncbi:MAG: ABC-type transport auxiliary lipoprotein family protein [Bacteroidota bacterium]|nr:ABC-type transport auxiliary lipoprotein family protein [Bacteroidota bacterium]
MMRVNPSITVGLLLLFTSCISEQSVTKKYYVISVQNDQADLDTIGFETILGSCEIEQVEINPVYESNQIVNRSDSHEISYYKYHQWAVRPAVTIVELIKNYLDSNDIFQSVSTRYSRAIPDYRFGTYIHYIEVIESNDAFSAHIKIEFKIIENSTNQVLLKHEADRTETLSTKDLNLFARTLSNILLSELKAFTIMIKEQRSTFEREGE